MVMLIDDISIGLGLFYAAKKTIDFASDRLIANTLYTPFERSQFERNQIEKDRMQEAAHQFKERMEHDRKSLRESHRNRMDQIGYEYFLRKWPLDNFPHEVINDLSSYYGKAINLIIYTNSPAFQGTKLGHYLVDSDADRQLVQNAQLSLAGDIHDLEGWLTTHYNKLSSSHPILPHVKAHPYMRKEHTTSSSLAITLREGLHTEPTIFLDLDLRSPTTIEGYVELWGLQNSESTSERHAPNWSHRLKLDMDPKDKNNNVLVQRDFALKALLAGLIDVSHLIYRFDEPHIVTPTAARVLADSFGGRLKGDLSSLVNYDHIIQKMSERSPYAAVSTCLDMVEGYDNLGDPNLSKHYFAMATKYLSEDVISDTWHRTTHITPSDNEHAKLLSRLRMLRNHLKQNHEEIDIESYPASHTAKTRSEDMQSLQEIAKRGMIDDRKEAE